MGKYRTVFITTTALVFIVVVGIGVYNYLQSLHLRQVKHGLLIFSHNKSAIRDRIAEIRTHTDGRWTDGRVGITGDGYAFYYDLHDSHGSDAIADVNVFYLPDEKRFIVSHKHFCVDLSNAYQPKSKAQLLPMFDQGM